MKYCQRWVLATNLWLFLSRKYIGDIFANVLHWLWDKTFLNAHLRQTDKNMKPTSEVQWCSADFFDKKQRKTELLGQMTRFNCSFFRDNIKLKRNEQSSIVSIFNFGNFLIIRTRMKLKLLLKRNKEYEDFHSRQLFAERVTWTKRKRNNVVRFDEISVRIEMTFGNKFLRLFP